MVQRLTWRLAGRLAIGVTGAMLVGSIGFTASRVDGFSMAPTLEDHDRLLVNKTAYAFSDPKPGDIVTFYYPPDPARLLVKRVIAVEGQTVQILGGRVLVNNRPLHDDYVPAAFRDHDDWGPKLVERGYEFVMGDHRNESSDSREWGFVPKRYIVGRVNARWWPLQDVTLF